MSRSRLPEIAALFMGLMILSCARPEEGCLDIRATNFDATADENCCCTYPTLRIQLSHAAGSAFHSPDSTYLNDLGQSCRIREVDFLLSDVSILIRDAGWVRVSDSLVLTLEDGSKRTIDDDIVHVIRAQSTYTIGTVLTSGELDSIAFRIGLHPELVQVDPDRFPADHPLRSLPESLYDSTTGYGSVALGLIVPPVNGDTLTWSSAMTAQVKLPVGQTVLTGYNIDIPLTVDYLEWIRQENLAQPQVIQVTEWMERIALSFRYGNL